MESSFVVSDSRLFSMFVEGSVCIPESTRSFNQFRWLSEADAVVWICGFLIFPFISVCISEITKRNERKWYYKNMQRLRLLFETRLGMYSPR